MLCCTVTLSEVDALRCCFSLMREQLGLFVSSTLSHQFPDLRLLLEMPVCLATCDRIKNIYLVPDSASGDIALKILEILELSLSLC